MTHPTCTICQVIDGDKTLGMGTLYRTPDHALLTAREEDVRGPSHVMFVSRDHDGTDADLKLYHRAVAFSRDEAPMCFGDGRYDGGEITVAVNEHGHNVIHLYGKV